MHRRLLPPAAVLLLSAPAPAVEPSDLRPGLVATFSDEPAGATIARVEPTVALLLAGDESPHPRLASGRLVAWKGYLNVVRPGNYTFAADLVGGALGVTIDGKRVFSAAADGRPTTGAETVTLPGRVLAFEATFARAGGPARVELRWEGPGFVREPLAHQFLGHLPDQRPPRFETAARLEHGRFRFEELACARCHKPAAGDTMAKGLADRPAPDLTAAAKRSYAGWLDAWLADPHKLRPDTAMPKMFADDAAGKVERHAVLAYLVSLAGRPLAPARIPTLSTEYRQSMERGRVLYHVTGCAACHDAPPPKPPADGEEDEKPPPKPEEFVYSLGTAGPSAKFRLGALGGKYRPDTLAAYLRDPLKVNPSGRMPHMTLKDREAEDLARYLCRVTDETLATGMPEPPAGADKTDAEWRDLGAKLVVGKGCVNCHAVEAGGNPVEPAAAFPPLEAVKKAAAGTGCLSATADPAERPAYSLAEPEREAIAAFLADGLTGAGSPSPAHAARAAVRRFNCLNCHTKDGEGGLSAELAERMRLMERAENADDVRPPTLTGIGHKARPSWLKAVLTDGGRARPWVQLRMPQYGPAQVGHLPHGLAALEGVAPDDSVHAVKRTPEAVAAGRAIIGKGGLGCISCHDIAGVPNTGTRGPDLATVGQRVRYDWYERWLHQPLRMAPGTRMPQAFVDGKSTLTTVLNGDPKAQAEAMWAYLSLGPGLPLPEGMEPPKGLLLAVTDRPQLLRTFLPDAGTRAVAVGYPGGVSLAFDADRCRLAYGWAGNFLDASPVWNNRGGGLAKPLGPRFWAAPPGHPWGLTVNPDVPPDFLGRADSPAFGATLPESPPRVYDGPRAVHFDGYRLDSAGRPTFRYRLTANPNGAELTVGETPVPVTSGVAAGVRRVFAVEAPAGYRAWFLAGVAAKEPRLIGTRHRPKAGVAVPATAGVRVLLPSGNDAATVLEVADAPAGTEWRFEPRPGGGWLALLRLPEAQQPLKAAFAVTVWGLPKDDDELLKGLVGK
jgi:cbb3-type cytochrome oxidase cytochrome c subunit